MMDWLREYNIADIEPFIEAVDMTREQYYNDGSDLLKDAVSIPGLLLRYVLNKALKKSSIIRRSAKRARKLRMSV